MNRDFVNFRAVYDELTDEVLRSRRAFVADHLQNWFRNIDETPKIAPAIKDLECDLNFEDFFERSSKTGTGGLGMGTFLWPESLRKRLGMSLLLFRRIAEREIDPVQLAFQFAWTSGDANDLVDEFNNQIFRPFARALRQYLQTKIVAEEQPAAADAQIPASDRIVALNDNNPAYQKTMVGLAKLSDELQQKNDYPDPDEKDRHVAEVDALKRLFQAVRVRVSLVIGIVASTLTYLIDKFAGGVVGAIAKSVWDNIQALTNR